MFVVLGISVSLAFDLFLLCLSLSLVMPHAMNVTHVNLTLLTQGTKEEEEEKLPGVRF